MSGTNVEVSIKDLVEQIQKKKAGKEADMNAGYSQSNPGTVQTPKPEEHVTDPVAQAAARNDQDPLNEHMGDNIAQTRAKLHYATVQQAGEEMKATAKADNPEEMPNADLVPAAPQQAASDIAPAGTGGPTPSPEAMPMGGGMSEKMSSAYEEKFQLYTKAAEDARSKGLAAEADAFDKKADLFRELKADADANMDKNAQAMAIVAELLGAGAAPAADAAGTETPAGEPAKEASDEAETRLYYEKVADDMTQCGEIIANVVEQRMDAREAKTAEAQKTFLEKDIPEAMNKALQTALAANQG